MKLRFILFRRARVYYCEDTTTRKQSSLKTKDKVEPLALLHSQSESFRQTRLNVQIARAYLTASDPAVSGLTSDGSSQQTSCTPPKNR